MHVYLRRKKQKLILLETTYFCQRTKADMMNLSFLRLLQETSLPYTVAMPDIIRYAMQAPHSGNILGSLLFPKKAEYFFGVPVIFYAPFSQKINAPKPLPRRKH